MRRQKLSARQRKMRRRGAFVVLAFFALVAAMGFVALNVDTGVVSLAQTKLQNAVDAAALAAAQEITAAVEAAGDEASGGGAADANAIAVGAAREMAAHVAEMNGVYVDPNRDVRFGKRVFNAQTGQFSIQWDVGPYNVVEVTARRDNPDAEAPDASLDLLFAPVMGTDTVDLLASAVAFVEARDLVLVLDYSASMNDDSEFRSIGKLAQSDIEANMQEIFEELGPPNVGSMSFAPQYLSQTESTDVGDVTVTFKNTCIDVAAQADLESVVLGFSDGDTQTFDDVSGSSGTFCGTGSNSGKSIDWCTVGAEDVSFEETEVADPSWTSSGADASISVTFAGTSASVESSENLKWVKLYFTDGTSQKHTDVSGSSATKSGTGEHAGKAIKKCKVKTNSGERQTFLDPNLGEPTTVVVESQFTDSIENVKTFFGLNGVAWPYPSGSWEDFLDHCRDDGDVRDAGYRRMYGGACLVDYLLNNKPTFTKCPDLWQTPHYPFHAMKEGTTLFTQFLTDLNFGDHIGLVTYATYSKVQTGLDEAGMPYVDLGDELITDDYAAIDTIQRHKQAGHFASTTGLGYGLEDARELLDSHGRYGARPTILLMTDGLANQSPSGWELPGDWDWSDMTDFDGDGAADYSTSNKHKQYALWQAKQAIAAGYTIHTLSVGAGADRDLMEAIAAAGGGTWVDVPGGSTIAELEAQMLAAFSQIAANVPPAKLLVEP